MHPAPTTAYFDPAAGAWILSRYADVLAAFRDPRLRTTTVSGHDQLDNRDENGRLAARAAMQESLGAARVAEWQPYFAAVVAETLAALPRDRPVCLLREFAQPVCLALAARVTGVPPEETVRLGDLAHAAFQGTGAEDGSEVQLRAEAATAELNRYFAAAPFRMGEPTFVGTSQTMARLLASGWLALLDHPAECQRLRDHPELMPTSVEELLRYAGIVPTLFRRAAAAVTIGAAEIEAGQRVHLKIIAANRDPDQFPEPDRLDLSRRAVSHLSLGTGRNSCVGNLVIRMASAVTAAALVAQFPQARLAGESIWESTASFHWPARVLVYL